MPMGTSDAIKAVGVGTSPASQQAVLRQRACGMLMATVVPPGPSLSKYSGIAKRHLSHSSFSACSGGKAGTKRAQLYTGNPALAAQRHVKLLQQSRGGRCVCMQLIGKFCSTAQCGQVSTHPPGAS